MVHGLWTYAIEHSVGQDVFGVRMYNGIDIGIRLQNRRMDIALRIAAYCSVHGRAVFDQIFANVLYSGNDCWACTYGKLSTRCFSCVWLYPAAGQ